MGWRFVGQRIQRVTDPLPSVTPEGRWGRWEAERCEMKKSWSGVVAAGVFLAGAGTAAAAAWHELPEMTVQGVYFYEGRYKFNPPGRNHGAFEWAGYLHDAVARDGHNVYMQVRVEGHGAVRYYGKQG